MSRGFGVIGLTVPGLTDSDVAIAASRAGGIGVLDLQWTPFHEPSIDAAAAVLKVARFAKGPWGVQLDGEDEESCERLLSTTPCSFDLAVLTYAPPAVLTRQITRLRQSTNGPGQIFVQVTRADVLPEFANVDGLIAKGNESGGFVSDETAFILLQRLMGATQLPVWVHGGIGLHSAAACRIAGAAGVVLDAQLCLARESGLPEEVRQKIARMDGGETFVSSDRLGRQFRCWSPLGGKLAQELDHDARELEASASGQADQWKHAVRSRIGRRQIWPLGQDAANASPMAERFRTVGRIVSAIREAAEHHLKLASVQRPLAEGSALAVSHGTRFPIVQGPMTRVSDNAAFALAVAEGGGLPFIALALSSSTETRKVLEETRVLLGRRPWGVGILGFVPLDVRAAQLEVIRQVRPAFALIAGGRPDQALSLENEGIATYLHTPSPELVKLFFEQGARRFVFEGRECGGHVGPRSSFVLWDAMIEALLSLQEGGADLRGVHVLFAGGVHDALSSSMVGAMAAPLEEAGVKVGVLLGTAYLFTREAVDTGAITAIFQQEAVRCHATDLLESGPGHASRCARTEFVATFAAERRKMETSGASPDAMRGALEDLTLGRLRIAAKGVARHEMFGRDPEAPKLVSLGEEEQRASGMYMLGQLAALRREVTTIEKVHLEVSAGGIARLAIHRTADSTVHPARPSDVAIIGVATLLPKAAGARQFWENILSKTDAITEIPEHRFDWRDYYDPDPSKPDRISSKWGGFLDDVAFDPMRYGMPPQSLPSIEPMQLLTLEVVRAAIADAGYADRPFRRGATSVILGAGGGLADLGQQFGMRSGLTAMAEQSNGIAGKLLDQLPQWTEDSFAGLLLNVAAGRVANRFDLGGLNFTVDAACASSLAAVYSGVRELESGASDMVLAGGVDTVQNPFGYLCFSKTHALSPEGRCKPFDDKADGTVISEGLAVLVLKRLADAERDGDRIYAVIKSVAGSSDGRGKGLTAPRPEGQIAALRRAYQSAGVNPSSVDLIEAHGTGTAAGDQAEIESLSRFFAGSRKQYCAIGSIKSMVGHTKCAAGAVGLIKTALALHEKVIPPTLNVENPTRRIDFPNSPFFVNTDVRPWVARLDGEPRRAGVSAFGFGGTNFHVVLEEYADDPAAGNRESIARTWPGELLVWSAESPGALQSNVTNLLSSLEGSSPALSELACATWRAFDKGRDVRLAIVAKDLGDLKSKLSRVSFDGVNPRGVYLRSGQDRKETGKIAFLFPGQGSQHLDMLRELAVCFTEVREVLEDADRSLSASIPEGLTSFIYPPSRFSDEDTARFTRALNQTQITQPAMGAVDIAISQLLDAFGIRGDVFAGHSYGEYVALCAAGALSKKSLYALSAARGKCLAEGSDTGQMLAVWGGSERVGEAIRGVEKVWIANVNSPKQTVLAGTPDGVAQAKERLTEAGLESRAVAVSCAFHSPLVARPKARLAEALAETEFRSPQHPVFSNTTGDVYPAEPGAIAALLSEHLVCPVRFMDEIEAMYQAGVRTFIEVGPRRVLTSLVGQVLEGRPHIAVASCGERSSLPEFLDAIAQLLVHGTDVSLGRLYRSRVDGHPDVPSVIAKGRPKEIPAGAWLVNGGRARRVGEPAIRPRLELPRVELSSPAPARQPTVVNGASASVIVRFQETMARFLDTQRATMMAYLGSGLGSDATPQREAAAMQEVPHVPVQPVAEPVPLAQHEPAQPAPVVPSEVRGEAVPVLDRLRTIISDRTGYPPEMLEPALNLEADLGIDSIKRIEILGAFQRGCVNGELQRVRSAMENLTSLKTIGSLSDALQKILGSDPQPQAVRPSNSLPRFTLTSVKSSPVDSRPLVLAKGAVLITDDGRGVAAKLKLEVDRNGFAAMVVPVPESADAAWAEDLIAKARRLHGPIAGVLHLAPLNADLNLSWRQRLATEVKGLFILARAAARDLRSHREPRGVLFAAMSLGGTFAVSGDKSEFSPVQGGVAGIVKTLALEWPEVVCRTIDFDTNAAADEMAARILAEMTSDGPVEVGYRGQERLQLQISPTPLSLSGQSLDQLLGRSPVILVTGGLRGITAKTTLALASRCRGKYLLVGKSPLPRGEESAATAVLESTRDIRKALVSEARRVGRTPDPSWIETELARLLREREMRANLRALEQTGSDIRYFPCDLANEREFVDLLGEIYRSHGAVQGVIHGAGIIEDRLVEDKEPESFDRVIAAKVTAAMVLAEHLRQESLRFLVFFSSVSGRFGNRGQADYAAANEILNKMAAHLNARWRARIVAINWGPWDGSNMVNETVREQFVRRGVQLIDPAAGAAALIDELLSGGGSEHEIILGGGPWQNGSDDLPLLPGLSSTESQGGGIVMKVRLDPSQHRYLEDHCIDGKPVLPATAAIELMAEVAQKAWPDYVVAGVRSVSVCKGIVVGEGKDVCVSVRPPVHYSAENSGLEINAEITDAGSAVLYYRCVVLLAQRLEASPQADHQNARSFGATAISAAEAYESRLFHGRRFHCIQRIGGLNEHGVQAWIKPSNVRDCMEKDARSWLIDPILLDAGPQLMILWAQELRGMTCLPSRFGEVRIFEGFAAALRQAALRPDIGELLECRLRVHSSGDGPIIAADFEVLNKERQIILSVQDLESTGSQSLNRLAVGSAVA